MAAAISPADRTLNLVISVSPLDTDAKTAWLSALEISGVTGGLNEIFVYDRSPPREVSGGNITNSGTRSSRAVVRERDVAD